MNALEIVRANLAIVRERIARACALGGRDPADVTLVAVTKYAQLDWMRPLLQLGVNTFGESRPQQLVQRASELPGVEWHLVGQLQRNKVRKVLAVASWIHSVDSRRLLEAIGRIAGEEGCSARVLLEVNLAGEETKSGFEPTRLRTEWDTLRTIENVEIGGLMAMPPLEEDENRQRSAFAVLRELRDELRSRTSDESALPQLSMGTSGDYSAAILEGATMIRVGRCLFRGLRDA